MKKLTEPHKPVGKYQPSTLNVNGRTEGKVRMGKEENILKKIRTKKFPKFNDRHKLTDKKVGKS